MNVDDFIIYEKTVPDRTGRYVEYPKNLSDEISEYLFTNGIKSLYSHQAEMFNKVMSGNNVVITTSTASGKTLAFLLPVIQKILEDSSARAIFIYPTKALASDQYRAIKPYIDSFGASRIVAGVYDGDTPVTERSHIRNKANIILTNPEMLNSAFLPNHSSYGFDFIFANLKFIIIDELHTYRGAFGSHLSNVFRRLQRVTKYYNSDPKYLCSSATIANPVELATEICGKPFDLINDDGSPSPLKKYVVIQPPRIKGSSNKDYGTIPVSTIAAHLVPELVVTDKSFLTFAKSRKTVEIILKESRDILASEGVFGTAITNKVSGYRGGYTPKERKDIEDKMISGTLSGLVTTNALELGIDIGRINTTVLAGYPGTRASFWQQTGRAGRGGEECTNYLILDYFPFDQFIAVNPNWLFEGDSETAVIDKNNLLIQLSHIRAAAAELPLTLNDISFFPNLGEIIPVLIKVKELTGINGKFIWSGKSFPAGDYSLRNIDKNRYKLINSENGKNITEMDEMQAFIGIHEGAIYIHDGILYQVIKLDLDSKTAEGIPFNGNYYTQVFENSKINIIQEFKKNQYKRTEIAFGDINVEQSVGVYKKIQFHNHQNLGFVELPKPLAKKYDTESTWIKIPFNVIEVFRSLIQKNQNGEVERTNHLIGLVHAIMNAARMVTMSTQNDICGHVHLDVLPDDSLQIKPNIYIYDKYIGGLGYSEKIYDLIPQIIDNAIKLVKGCHCKNGCPICIGDNRLDKNIIEWGLQNFLEEKLPPIDIKMIAEKKETITVKPFVFEELPEKWSEFCKYAAHDGDLFSAFLEWVPKVEILDSVLLLTLTNKFYSDWVMEENNRKSLANIINYYVQSELEIGIEVVVVEDVDENLTTTKKIQKRYENLLEK